MFKIASYNILADACVPGCGLETDLDLSWENRKGLLEKRLRELDADVIGLQEVDAAHLESFLSPFCQKNGYHYYYCPRSVTEAARNHGVALLYRISRFKIVSDSTKAITNAKNVKIVRLVLKGTLTQLQFLVGHLQSRTDGSKSHIRTQQAHDIVALMRSTTLNRWLLLDANSDQLREGEELFKVFENAGYKNPISPPQSFTTKKCRTGSFDTSKDGIRERSIDYIMCHDENTFKPYSYIRHLAADLLPNVKEPSDHLPQQLLVSN